FDAHVRYEASSLSWGSVAATSLLGCYRGRSRFRTRIRSTRQHRFARLGCGGVAVLRANEMIGIVVVTHGRLGEEMVRTLNGVLGPVPGLRAVSSIEADPEIVKGEIRRMLERVDDGDEVLVLTDMLGDTATNLSLMVADTSLA